MLTNRQKGKTHVLATEKHRHNGKEAKKGGGKFDLGFSRHGEVIPQINTLTLLLLLLLLLNLNN